MNINQLSVALYTIVYKEVRRFMRIWPQTLLPPAITSSLSCVIVINLIGARIGDMCGYIYMCFIVGTVFIIVVITKCNVNDSSIFFRAKFQKRNEDMIKRPVPMLDILWCHV